MATFITLVAVAPIDWYQELIILVLQELVISISSILLFSQGFYGVDIPSAGVPYLNVMRWGSSKILDMIV